jgi:hypothetical protein
MRPSTIALAAAALLALAAPSALAILRGNDAPAAVKRGGGPQTGTGTSDVVRSVVPPKNQG